jgi:pentatricopeptide repeat protein
MTKHFAPASAASGLVFGCLLAPATLANDSSTAVGDPAEAKVSDVEAALIERGESILPFVSRDAVSPDDARKVRALGFYGAARVREQNEEFATALRLYQRAHRKDPRSLPILQRIVPLSLHLDHEAEAARYTLKAVELGYREPQLLRGFGLRLTDEGRWADALVMYEALLPDIEPKTGTFIALRAEMGRLAYLAEHYDDAAEAFADVLAAIATPDEFGLSEVNVADLLGDKTITYGMFADALLKAGRLEEAEAVLDRLKTTAGNQAEHDYHRARLEAARENFDAALVSLEAYLATQPTNRITQPYELLSEVLAGLDRSDELQAKLEALRAEKGDNAPLTFFLAQLYTAEAQWDHAAELLETVIADEPFVEAFEALITVYLRQDNAERLVHVLGRVEEVGGELSILGDELVDDIKSDADLLERLFAILDDTVVEDGGDGDATDAADSEEARADAMQADFGRCAAMTWLAANTGDVERAERLFRQAVELKPDAAAEMYSQWGIGLLMAEKYAAAWDVFAEGIERGVTSADNPIFNYLGAGALVMAERYDEALAAARKAAENNAANPRLASRVAWVLYQAERYDEATEAYVKLVTELEDNHASAAVRDVLRDARLVLSNLALEQDDRARAEEWLEEILDEFPDDVSAKNDLGYLWVERGAQLDEALEMIQQAVAADPDNPAYLDSLGWAYYMLGRYDEAVAELSKAIADVDDPDGVILDHLADALLKTGRVKEAREAWQRAARAFDTAGDREKLEGVRAKLTDPAAGGSG